MQSLIRTLKNLGIDNLVDPQASISSDVTLESLDAVHTASHDLEEASGVMDELYEGQASLEAIAVAIEATLTEGGMSAQTAAMAQVALTNEQKRLGLATKTVSLEAFAEDNREASTQISLEGVKETLQKVWEAIVKVAKAVWDAIKRFFDAIVNWLSSAGKKAGELLQRVKKNATKTLKVSLEGLGLESDSDSHSFDWNTVRWITAEGKLAPKGAISDIQVVAKYPEIFIKDAVPENLLELEHYDTDASKHQLVSSLSQIVKSWDGKAEQCGFKVTAEGGTKSKEHPSHVHGVGYIDRLTRELPGGIRFGLSFPKELAGNTEAIHAVQAVANGPYFYMSEEENTSHRPKDLVIAGSWVVELLEEVPNAEGFGRQMKKDIDACLGEFKKQLDEAKGRLIDNDKYYQQAVRVYLQGCGRQIQTVGRANHTVMSIIIKVVRAVIHVGEAYAKAA